MSKKYVLSDKHIELYYAGWSLTKLSSVCKVDSNTVKAALSRQGVQLRTRSESYSLRESGYVATQEIIDAYLLGSTLKQLEERFGVDDSVIRYAFLRQGIPIRSRLESAKLINQQLKAIKLRDTCQKRRLIRPRKTPIGIRETVEWKEWRERVYSRDSWRCIDCGSSKHLDPHHIKKKSVYPELTFDVNNGVTLCRSCHRKTFWKEMQYEKQYLDYVRNQASP